MCPVLSAVSIVALVNWPAITKSKPLMMPAKAGSSPINANPPYDFVLCIKETTKIRKLIDTTTQPKKDTNRAMNLLVPYVEV